MSFPLVPNSMTLDYLELRNNGSVISPNSVAFGIDCVKVVEDTQHFLFLQQKCRPKNLVFSDIIVYGSISRRSPPREHYSEALPSRSRKFDQ